MLGCLASSADMCHGPKLPHGRRKHRLTEIKEVRLITYKELARSSSVSAEESGWKLFRDVYCSLSQELGLESRVLS